MTFSDAEDDQPSAGNRGNSTSSSVNQETGTVDQDNSELNQASSGTCDESASTNCNSEPNYFTVSDSQFVVTGGSHFDDQQQDTHNSGLLGSESGLNMSSDDRTLNHDNNDAPSNTAEDSEDFPQANVADHISDSEHSEQASGAAAIADSQDDIDENKDLESQKIMEKLHQIQSYIQQTTNAMEALENEGNMNKLGQYNTLTKVMRDLKRSESNLLSHLNVIKEKHTKQTSETNSHDSPYSQFEVLFNALQNQETECIDLLSKSLLALENEASGEPSQDEQPKESGSESIGVVDTLSEEGNRPTMQERLNRHQNEQEILSARLRESLVRRQELMTRYQATRERLNNLKRQRVAIAQEERRLLSNAGTSDSPYEDPIPGADLWTIDQLESAIQDFRALREKVDRVHEAYTAKIRFLGDNDDEERTDLQRKIEQILNKRSQIDGAVNQMRDILLVKRQHVNESNELDQQPSDGTDHNHEEPSSAPEPLHPSAQESNPDSHHEDQRETSSGDPSHLPQEEDQDQSSDSVAGAEALSTDSQDLMAKQQYLQSLKNQLSAMKRLLTITQNESASSANQEAEEENASQNGVESTYSGSQMTQSHDVEDENNLIGNTIVGVHGEVIHLSEIERRDPSVVEKYKQLARAKERLAKMEEVMKLISDARQSGQSLEEVLSPENMAILRDAQEDAEPGKQQSTGNDEPAEIRVLNELLPEAQSHEPLLPQQTQMQQQRCQRGGSAAASVPKRNDVNELPEQRTTDHGVDWERDREISSMQYHLIKKKAPGIPSINDGSRVGREKGAVKKPTRNLFCDTENDPRVNEVLVLQEELREKKNALEALMKKMGKSSSFMLDNISDNISGNISDLNSEACERPSASWGAAQEQQLSDGYQSDDDATEGRIDDTANARLAVGAASDHLHDRAADRHRSSVTYQTVPPKNRNRYSHSSSKTQRSPEAPQYSVNILGGSLPRSVRPKQNRTPGGGSVSMPVTSWEGIDGGTSTSAATQDPTTKVQNTVAAALSQLSQVQETINTLYEDLRNTERASRRQSLPPLLRNYGNNASVPLQQLPFALNAQNMGASYQIPHSLQSSDGRGGELGATNHLVAGLQQCFSQLYLHSLEIQSLSKHLQLLDQREKSSTPSHQREFSQDRRNERPSLSTRSEQTHDRHVPHSFSHNYSWSDLQAYEDESKEPPQQHNPNHSRNIDTETLSTGGHYIDSRRNENSAAGVSNPIYDRITSGQPSSWPLHDPADAVRNIANKNFFSPFEDQNNERCPKDGRLDSSTGFPPDSEDITDNLPWTWAADSSGQIHNQHSSDILNNQVLPGTRANNYWDNFRSYSRQNPLSAATKFNTSDRQSVSCRSVPGTQPRNFNGRIRSMSFENRQYNLTSASNHSINKASDKNSSTSRSQNMGARSRYLHQQGGSRKSAVSDSHLSNFVSATADQRISNNARKHNNRPKYVLGGVNEQDSLYQDESSRSYRFPSPDTETHDTMERDSGSRSQRLGNAEDRQDQCAEFPRHLNLHRQNTSQEDLTTSATYSLVVREAESLMQKHSEQPQFLLQLFHHASGITGNTDQHVALELLKELSNQERQLNTQAERWNSNSSIAQTDVHSASQSTKRRGSSNYRNEARFRNKNSHGISGTDSTESGVSSDDDEGQQNQRLYQMVKNLNPSPSGGGNHPHTSTSPQNYARPSSQLPIPRRISPAPALNQRQLPGPGRDSAYGASEYLASADQLKSENQSYGDRTHRINENPESSVQSYITNLPGEVALAQAVHNGSSCELDSHRNEREHRDAERNLNLVKKKKSPRRDMGRMGEEKSNFALKNHQKNFNIKHTFSSYHQAQQRSVGFESIVSAALREVLRMFEWTENSNAPNIQVLESLHLSIMKQIELQSKSLGFSSNFITSVDAQLKAALQSFCGKRISQVRQEIAAAVTQILIHQYCSILVHQERPSDYIQPQTPDSNFVEDYRPTSTSNAEADETLQNVRLCSNQPSLDSLLNHSESHPKQGRPIKSAWSFAANDTATQQANREKSQANIIPQGKEDVKTTPVNLSRGKSGAISKNSSSNPIKNENFILRSAIGNHLQSSAFPESWIASRGASAVQHAEGNDSISQEAHSHTHQARGDREPVDASDKLDGELNDVEADQEHTDMSIDFHSSSLPVHDLAEADQSHEAAEADGAASSVESESPELTAGAYCQPVHQTQDSPIRLMARKNLSSNAGLDEVPTRLLSGPDGACVSVTSIINGRHPPDGVASSSENRFRVPPSHASTVAPSQYSPSHSNGSQQMDGRHPPDGGTQPSQHPTDAAGNME